MSVSIEVAVTTAPRKYTTLNICLQSLKEAGFDRVNVYAEPESDLKPIHNNCRLVKRGFKFGAWRNWLYASLDMVETTDSDAIMMVQDDTEWNTGVRNFLERDLWPHKKTGYIQLCVSRGYKRIAGSRKGCIPIPRRNTKRLMGAWGVIFPRKVLEAIVWKGFELGWDGPCSGRRSQAGLHPSFKKGIDPFIGYTCSSMNLKGYLYNPSMAQHLARDKNSTLGHDKKSGKELDIRFALNYSKQDVRNTTPKNPNPIQIK